MQASEIRDTILSEMSIRISAMQTEADIKQILDFIGLDCAVDKINKIVKFHSDAEHCFAILESCSKPDMTRLSLPQTRQVPDKTLPNRFLGRD